MPTLGGGRAQQKILQEAASNMTDANAVVKSGADMTFAVLNVESGLSATAQAKLSGADALSYDANN